MPNVLVTGGAGFLGSRLARYLLAAGRIDVAGRGTGPVSRLTLIDRAPVPADLAAEERVSAVRGDLAELLANRDVLTGTDVVFHLAAAVSAECEADFDLGIRVNVRATEALLESCRALGTSPVVVFASSVAVFGSSAEHPLPAVVDDHTMPNPQSSYGAQKVMSELLLADCTRKGFVRGRTVRLMTVCVRPGRPNAAASSFLSGIIREPLAGERAICPVGPATEVALASPARATDGLLCAAASSEEGWGGRTAVNLPGAHRHRRRHGRGARTGSRTSSQRPHRLDTRPVGGRDRDRLASPVPRRSGRQAGPCARPGLRLRHRDAPGREPRC